MRRETWEDRWARTGRDGSVRLLEPFLFIELVLCWLAVLRSLEAVLQNVSLSSRLGRED